jgi:peptide/nickel transport system ATP-binding protein/oligopeptide transport system ATP-binding protein
MSLPKTKETVILEVQDLKQYFPIKGGIFGRTVNHVKAVDGVDFSIYQGETVSIVGESGCGKSTTGRAILRLDEPTNGKVIFQGTDILGIPKREMRPLRKDLQVIFQDPFASLNPRRTIGQTLEEAMATLHVVPKEKRKDRAIELLEQVGLKEEHFDRYPHEFSGGQRQRIGIARALAVEPKLIICDEAVSALDVSVQAQVLNLLKKLQKEYDLTYLFISHDLGVVRHISDRIIVMYLGKVVEVAEKKQLFDSPLHPYTQALLSAIPEPNRKKKKERIILKGEVPSPINPPTGCRFHTRCPLATDLCRSQVPELRLVERGHQVSCHYAAVSI